MSMKLLVKYLTVEMCRHANDFFPTARHVVFCGRCIRLRNQYHRPTFFLFNYSISHFLLETKTSKLFMGISAVFFPILFIVARLFFFEYRQNLDMFFNGNWNATIKWNLIVKRYDFSFFIADNFTKKNHKFCDKTIRFFYY